MTRRRTAPAALLGLGLALGATACTGSDPDDDTAPAPRTPTPTATTGPDGGPTDGPSGDAEPATAFPDGGAPTSWTVEAGEPVLGLKWNWSQLETLDYAAAVPGGGWTFAEVEWCRIEPVPGTRTWDVPDRIVRRSEELGYRVMLKIRTGQCWATRPPEPGAPDRTEATRKTPSTAPVDPASYQDFVTEMVQRYRALDVHTYSVENEPDVYNFWAGPIADYESTVRLAAEAVHAADPGAVVLDAGLSSTGYGVVLAQGLLDAGDPDAATATYQAYYGRRQAGLASRWRPVSGPDDLAAVLATPAALRANEVVDATQRLVADGVVDAYQLHFYEETDRLPGVLAMIRERMGPVPVEGWEVGVAWPGDSYDAAEAAAETLRLTATLLAAGVRRVVYLPLAYTPGSAPQVFRGLVDEDGTLLPAGAAFAKVAALLDPARDRVLTGVAARDGVRGVVLATRRGQGSALVWDPDGGTAALRGLPAGTEVTEQPTLVPLPPQSTLLR